MPTDAHPIKGYVRLFRISRQRACPIRKRQAAAAVGALTCFLMPRNCREANVTSETRRPSFSVCKELWVVRHIGNDFLLVAKSSCTTHVIAVYFSFLPTCNKEPIAFPVECHARRLFFSSTPSTAASSSEPFPSGEAVTASRPLTRSLPTWPVGKRLYRRR